jgi:hypothetical protein
LGVLPQHLRGFDDGHLLAHHQEQADVDDSDYGAHDRDYSTDCQQITFRAAQGVVAVGLTGDPLFALHGYRDAFLKPLPGGKRNKTLKMDLIDAGISPKIVYPPNIVIIVTWMKRYRTPSQPRINSILTFPTTLRTTLFPKTRPIKTKNTIIEQ